MTGAAESRLRTRAGRREGGFTLLEILVAMTILAVGGVSVVALFASAVQLQYKSAIEDEVALLLEPLHQIAQDKVDGFVYTAEKPVPDAVAPTEIVESPGYSYEMAFTPAHENLALPGEGFWVSVKVHPPGGGKPVSPPRLWFLKRQVFNREELKGSISYDRERRQEDEGRDRADDREPPR